MKPKIQYLPASGPNPGLVFQEFQDDERVECKRGSEHQRLAEHYKEERRFVVASLRGLGTKIRQVLQKGIA